MLARALRLSPGARRRAAWRIGVAGVLALAAARLGAPTESWLAGAALGWTLTALCQHDVARYRLPDALTAPLLGLGLGLAALTGDVVVHVLTAAAAYGVCWGISEAWLRWRGRDGLGLGDAKLIAAAGAWLGPHALPDALLIACAVGALWALAASLRHGFDAGRPIPFGPAIALGFAARWLASL